METNMDEALVGWWLQWKIDGTEESKKHYHFLLMMKNKQKDKKVT